MQEIKIMVIHIRPSREGDNWDIEMEDDMVTNVPYKRVAGIVSGYVDRQVRLNDPRWCYWCDRGKRECACEAEVATQAAL